MEGMAAFKIHLLLDFSWFNVIRVVDRSISEVEVNVQEGGMSN